MNTAITPSEADKIILNSSVTRAGSTVSESHVDQEEKRRHLYLISEVWGSAITIKDDAGVNILASIAGQRFITPLKIAKGFTISGTNLQVRYAEVPIRT